LFDGFRKHKEIIRSGLYEDYSAFVWKMAGTTENLTEDNQCSRRDSNMVSYPILTSESITIVPFFSILPYAVHDTALQFDWSAGVGVAADRKMCSLNPQA
jgi:hypothetical protein